MPNIHNKIPNLRDGNNVSPRSNGTNNHTEKKQRIIKNKILIFSVLIFIVSLSIFITLTKTKSHNPSNNNADYTDIKKTDGTFDNYTSHNNLDDKSHSKNSESQGFLDMLAASFKNFEISDAETAPNKKLEEINMLSQEICNDENLPGDIWISPKILEENIDRHIEILEQLKSYCYDIQSGSASKLQKKNYFELKLELLEEKHRMSVEYNDIMKNFIDEIKEKIAIEKNKEIREGMIKQLEIVEKDESFHEIMKKNNDMISKLNAILATYKQELAKL